MASREKESRLSVVSQKQKSVVMTVVMNGIGREVQNTWHQDMAGMTKSIRLILNHVNKKAHGDIRRCLFLLYYLALNCESHLCCQAYFNSIKMPISPNSLLSTPILC